MTFLRQITAFRYLVYAVILPLMLLEHIGIALRTGWDLWCALVDQHEAGFRPTKPRVLTPAEEIAVKALRSAVDAMDLNAFSQPKALPANGRQTVKFRRYTEPRGPFAATCDTK